MHTNIENSEIAWKLPPSDFRRVLHPESLGVNWEINFFFIKAKEGRNTGHFNRRTTQKKGKFGRHIHTLFGGRSTRSMERMTIATFVPRLAAVALLYAKPR